MIQLTIKIILSGTLAAIALPATAATVDELILACEKLKRAEDRANCFKEAIRSTAAPAAEAKTQSQKAVAVTAAEDVVKALRRLGSAVSVGITLRDYSQLLVTESAVIDEALRSVPDGKFKGSALKSRQAFIDAREIWSQSIQEDYLSVFRIVAEPILKRYAIEYVVYDLRLNKPSDIPKSSFLSPIWNAAQEAAAEADSEIASIMVPPAAPKPAATVSAPVKAETQQPERKNPWQRQPTAEDQLAVKTLRKIDDAADTKLGLIEYSKLISADVVAIDRALRDMPDDEFRNHIVIARQAYIDARNVWHMSEQQQYLSLFVEAARPQLQRYSVSIAELNAAGTRDMTRIPKHLFLFPIWREARLRIDDAERLLTSAGANAAPKAEATSPGKH
ncbi:hypothetical protein FXN63_14195 [Pigmentiphaga aceris]|uniref:DUF3829 domain-containing protein n=1 Tax=Pigmentiphaga aceris TaxID=1940612 RepID=A0A5C0B2L1_9BURK|nr:hypothetical protein [Pigmentiphaga aceris]QEI06857.1 hypothetical protein FXN63_14195 [Pigmentiphaga aceris]